MRAVRFVRRFGSAIYPTGGIFPRLDFEFITKNAQELQANANRRNASVDVQKVVAQWEALQRLRKEVNLLRGRRNTLSWSMIKLGAKEKAEAEQEGRELKKRLAILEPEIDLTEHELYVQAAKLPNITHASVGDVPITLRTSSSIEELDFSKQGFTPMSHLEIGSAHDLFDFETATEIAGPRFVIFKHEAALLELALVNFTLQKLVSKGFTPCLTPDLAIPDLVSGTGFQPRSSTEKQTFEIRDHELCLVGTSEIPLAGMYRNKILKEHDFPLKLAAFSHCFRTEVGHAGQATKGAYRLHQFSKVEMFGLCLPSQSEQMFEELVAVQEELFKDLGLHYRVLEMPAHDLGAPAARKIDIEAWMPQHAGGSFGEISSASNCTDYQSRRLAIRYKDPALGKSQYVHTLNATGCAVPRLIVALLEQHQQQDGTVAIPACLQPFMLGAKQIPFLPRKK